MLWTRCCSTMFLDATNIGILWAIVSMINLRPVGKFHVDLDARERRKT